MSEENKQSYVDDILSKMLSGEVKVTSTMNLRNENRQTRSSGGFLPFLKKEKNKTSKLLILKEVPLGFNPFTGEADDEINLIKKFRPQLTCTTIIHTLKKFYNEHGDIKSKTVFRDWDVSDITQVTEEDRKQFERYEVSKVFTHDMINVNSKTLTGNAYGASYRSNIKRNDLGDVVDEEGNELEFNDPKYPEVLRYQQLYSSIYTEKYNRWEAVNKTKSDKDKKTKFSEVMGDSPISKDMPTNFVICVELPMDASFNIKDLDKMTAEDVYKHLVVAKRPKNMKTSLDKLETVYKDTRNIYVDWFELDMIVGDEDDDAQRGLNTKYNNAEVALKGLPGFDKFMVAFTECINNFDKSEEVVTKSVARKEMNESVLDRFCEAVALEQKLEDLEEYISSDVAERFAREITSIYGDKATDLLTSLDAGDLPDPTLTDDQKKSISTLTEEEASGDTDTEVTIVEEE